jgi:RNA polymerase sigma factor (sigma-70 family)
MDLAEVTSALAPRLIAYLRARTGNRALAEDLPQDALVALVQAWRRHGPPDSPDAFVFAIAKRRAGRALARQAVLSPLDALWGKRDTGVAVDVAMEHREAVCAVLKAIRGLPRRDREVLLLSATGELSIADIAAVTETTPAAVKMRLSRVRQRLTAMQRETTHEQARAAK